MKFNIGQQVREKRHKEIGTIISSKPFKFNSGYETTQYEVQYVIGKVWRLERALMDVKKELNRSNDPIVTCQICERDIKGNTGIIAHHGYKRPGDGYQTPSCLGARQLPYEVSKDALPPAIEHINAYITNTQISLKNFLENPPETLIYLEKSWDPRSHKEVCRPDGFVYKKDHGSFSMAQRYELEYHSRVYNMESNIKWAQREEKRLQKRLADWKPVYTKAEWEKLTPQN